MKLLVQAVAATMLVAEQYDLKPKDAGDFMAGLVEGLLKKDDFKEFKLCIDGAASLENKVATALGEILKGDIGDIVNGFEDLYSAMGDFPMDFENCQQIQEDMARIESWGQIFHDPKKLALTVATNMLMNFGKISADFVALQSDVKAGKFEVSGEDVADIMVLTIGKVPEASEVDMDTIKFTQW